MEEARCAAHLFTYDEDQAVPMKTFFSYYRHQFPMLAVIIDGYYGETIYDCFENLQVLRINCYSSQPRVICTDCKASSATDATYYTIPVKFDYAFRKVKGHTSVGESESLQEILDGSELPVMVQFACSSTSSVKFGPIKRTVGSIGNLLITDKYEENYIMANCVDTTGLKMNPEHCLMALSDQITITPITGFKYKSKKEYQDFLKELDHQVATNVRVYDKTRGDPCIAMHHADEETNIYTMPDIDVGKVPPKGQDKSKDDLIYDSVYECPDEPPKLPARHQKPPPAIACSQSHTPETPTDTTQETKHQKKQFIGTKLLKTLKSNIKLKHGTSAGQAKEEEGPPVPKKPVVKENWNIGTGQGKKTKKPYENTPLSQAVVRPMVKAPVTGTAGKMGDNSHNTEDPGQHCESGDEDYEEVYDVNPKETESTESDDDYIEMVDCADSNIMSKGQPQKTLKESVKVTNKRPVADDRVSEKKGTFNKHIAIDQVSKSPGMQAEVGSEGKRTFNKDFTIDQVIEVLHALRLEKYTETFREERVDGDMLTQLTVDDMMTELNMKKLEAIRLSRYIEAGHVPK